jgi:hypothetical protein
MFLAGGLGAGGVVAVIFWLLNSANKTARREALWRRRNRFV